MTQSDIDALADDALNAAVAHIQHALGQTDGGFAALYLSGEPERVLRTVLAGYIVAEINEGPCA